MPAAKSIIDNVYERWARQLLGGDTWRNAAVATSEVGWRISGYARVVQAVALRSARMLSLPASDFYRGAFIRAAAGGPSTWACKSKACLAEWALQDWPSWSQTGGDYDQYKSYVARSLETQCLAAWTPVAERHRSKIPYCAFQAGPGGPGGATAGQRDMVDDASGAGMVPGTRGIHPGQAHEPSAWSAAMHILRPASGTRDGTWYRAVWAMGPQSSTSTCIYATATSINVVSYSAGRSRVLTSRTALSRRSALHGRARSDCI